MSSSLSAESVMTCMACGASIYQEHIDRGLAGMWAGEMLCPACLREKKEADQARGSAHEVGSLPLMDESEPAGDAEGMHAAESLVLSPAGGLELGDQPAPQALAGAGARHVRIFHAKLSEGAVRHLAEQVNTWLESHPDVEVKFAHTTVGVWEGKHAESNLILTVFY